MKDRPVYNLHLLNMNTGAFLYQQIIVKFQGKTLQTPKKIRNLNTENRKDIGTFFFFKISVVE